jgi:hypothetical protein
MTASVIGRLHFLLRAYYVEMKKQKMQPVRLNSGLTKRHGKFKEDLMNVFTLPLALFLAVAASGMWAFIAVVSWAGIRRKEREAYYRHETMKKISEMPGENGLALLREDERSAMRRQRENIKLGGLITAAAGIGLMIFLRAVDSNRPVYLAGLIALLVGLALLSYSYILAPKD